MRSILKKFIELFAYRELILNLAIKELKVRYRYATGGIGWIVIYPIAMSAIFYAVFKFIFKIGIENYTFFLLCGLFPWAFLQVSLGEASASIIANANLIKKARFPREAVPFSIIAMHLIAFVAPLAILFITALFFKISATRIILWLPLILFIQLLLTTGLSLILSSLNACYRDIQFAYSLILMIWFYATPIVYSVEMAKDIFSRDISGIYVLNPMAGIVTAYRDIFLYSRNPDLLLLSISFIISAMLFISGLFIFGYLEKRFIDII